MHIFYINNKKNCDEDIIGQHHDMCKNNFITKQGTRVLWSRRVVFMFEELRPNNLMDCWLLLIY